jgi:hypothetical protein
MTPDEITMHLTPPPGVRVRRYPPWQDQVYRVSLAVAAGALALRGGALIFQAETVALAGAVLLAASTLVASYTFLVWIDRYRHMVMALAVVGTGLLAMAMPWGVGFLMAAGSVMAAKETHCFRFPTGRVIPWVAAAAALTGLVPGWGRINGVGLVVVAALWVPLLWARFRMRLITVTGG